MQPRECTDQENPQGIRLRPGSDVRTAQVRAGDGDEVLVLSATVRISGVRGNQQFAGNLRANLHRQHRLSPGSLRPEAAAKMYADSISTTLPAAANACFSLAVARIVSEVRNTSTVRAPSAKAKFKRSASLEVFSTCESASQNLPATMLPGFRLGSNAPASPAAMQTSVTSRGIVRIALNAFCPPMPVSKTATSFEPIFALYKSNSRRCPASSNS